MKRSFYSMTIGFALGMVEKAQIAILKAAESLKFWTWVFITWALMTHRIDMTTLEYLGFTAAVIGIGAWKKRQGLGEPSRSLQDASGGPQ